MGPHHGAARGSLIRSTVLAGAAVCTVVVALLVVVAHSARVQERASRASERTVEVLSASQLLERETVDLETGLRGYAATGARLFLAPTMAARAALPAQLADLRRRVAGMPAQASAAAALARAVTAYEEGYLVPFLRPARPPRGSALLGEMERGKRLLDALRARFQAFDSTQQRLELSRDRAASATAGRLAAVRLIAAGIVIAVVLALIGLVFWRVVVPVRRVIRACARVGEGNLELRLPQKGRDELSQLSRAFNAMVDGLEDREAEIEAGAGELEEALGRLEAVIDTAHNAFVSIDEKGTITAWNPSAERIFGFARADALGRPMADLIVPERHREAHRRGFERFMEEGTPRVLGQRLELSALRADGSEFPIEMTIASAFRGGRPIFHAFIADITERREQEREIRLLAAAVDGSQDAIISKDTCGIVTSWNRGAELLYGFTAEEMIGRPIGLIIPDERAGEDRELLAGALGHGGVQQLQTERLRKDGTRVEVSLTVSPIMFEGRAIGACAIARDITDRRAAQRVLEEREQQLADAQALARVGSWEWKVGAPTVSYSDELCRILGREPGWTSDPQGYVEHIHPHDRKTLEEYNSDLYEGEVVHRPYRITRADGRVRHVTSRSYTRRDEHGEVTTMYGVVQDVTEQVEAEQERQELVERFERAFADAAIGMAIVSLDGRWLRVNRALCEIVGYDPEQLLALTFQDITHPDDLEADLALVEDLLAGRRGAYQLEKRYLHRDGRQVWIRLSVSLVRDGDGRPLYFVSQIEDVTARRGAEQALRASEERFASIVDNVPGVVYRFALSPDGSPSLRYVSEGARAMYGRSPEELLEDVNLILGRVHPDDGPEFQRSVQESARLLERWDWHGRHLDEDGTLRYVHGSAHPVREPDGTVVWDGVVSDETERRIAQERESAARRRLQLVLDNLPGSGVSPYDHELRLVFCEGPLFADLDVAQWIGRRLHEVADEEAAALLAPGLASALAGEPSTMVLENPRMGVPLAVAVAPYREADGTVSGALVHWHDISALRAAESEAQAAGARFHQAFEAAPIGMALLSPEGAIEQVNEALRGIVDRTSSELQGERLAALVHPADRERALEALQALAGLDGGGLDLELRLIRAAGPAVEVSLHGSVLRDPSGKITQILCQLQDVTERKRYESQLQFMADHDPLTGLLNRRKFEAELDRHVGQVRRYGAEGALIALDIDHFKQVNDTLGHNAGDQLIVSIAGVLRGALRESDVLARLGGDEFAILLPKAGAQEAEHVARKIVESVRTKVTLLDGEAKRVTTSVGVATFESRAEDLTGESILVEADLAMYDAKEAGRDGYAFYTTSEHEVSRTKARLTWVARIEQALEHDRFALAAQPILDLHTGQVRQHELLIRMLDDRDELIPPATFLYIAERFGLVGRIDEWVVTRAVDLLEQRPGWQLEVNISGRSLGDQRLLAAIEQRLGSSPIDPARLILEVTETAAVANITQAQTFAQRLRDLGCRFALDDFGAGFGSFYYLKHLPFDYVKIDGEFVQHAVSGHVDRLVIEAVVRIASGLGKETIAEFVADERTQRLVTRLGVDYAQGYHIGRPVPVETLLDDRSAVSDAL